MKEFELIEWIRRQVGEAPGVVVGPGDDCAVLAVGDETLLLTTDQVLDGVHVSLADHGPELVGRKAAARAVSDIAAMGGEPVAMVASVALPSGMSSADARALCRGLRAVGCPLAGGDVAAWRDEADRLQMTVTVLGRAGGVGPLLRSGAAVGDAVCVTGSLGGAWRTRRHLTFTPRVAEGRLLAQEYGLHAMIDVSDGLAADLGHIVTESHVAAEIVAEDIPIHPDARDCDDPLAAALFDGEDYELLFALPADGADRLIAEQPLDVPVTRIGTIGEGEGMVLVRDGTPQALEARGWEHGMGG
ncbi:MAG: thiamine-phosphate kinase [Planctomycetota bacterium]|jgi:thiamine-monophosphate kinase